jgi:hypothetical protein
MVYRFTRFPRFARGMEEDVQYYARYNTTPGGLSFLSDYCLCCNRRNTRDFWNDWSLLPRVKYSGSANKLFDLVLT